MDTNEIINDAIEYAVSKGTIMVTAPGSEITSLLPRATDKDSAHRSLGDIVTEGAAGLALHAGAFVWSTLAGITGDYTSLGGYGGIYQRLEMGLARLRSKEGFRCIE